MKILNNVSYADRVKRREKTEACLDAIVVQLSNIIIPECLGDLLKECSLDAGVLREAVHARGQDGRSRLHPREEQQHEVGDQRGLHLVGLDGGGSLGRLCRIGLGYDLKL